MNPHQTDTSNYQIFTQFSLQSNRGQIKRNLERGRFWKLKHTILLYLDAKKTKGKSTRDQTNCLAREAYSRLMMILVFNAWSNSSVVWRSWLPEILCIKGGQHGAESLRFRNELSWERLRRVEYPMTWNHTVFPFPFVLVPILPNVTPLPILHVPFPVPFVKVVVHLTLLSTLILPIGAPRPAVGVPVGSNFIHI